MDNRHEIKWGKRNKDSFPEQLFKAKDYYTIRMNLHQPVRMEIHAGDWENLLPRMRTETEDAAENCLKCKSLRIQDVYIELEEGKTSEFFQWLRVETGDSIQPVRYKKNIDAFTVCGKALIFRLAENASAGKNIFLHIQIRGIKSRILQRIMEFAQPPAQFVSELERQGVPGTQPDNGAGFYLVNLSLRRDKTGDVFLYIKYRKDQALQWKPVRKIVGYDFSLGRGKFLIASDFCDIGFPEFDIIGKYKREKIENMIKRYTKELQGNDIRNGERNVLDSQRKLTYWKKRKIFLQRNLDHQKNDFFAQLAARLTKNYDVIILETIRFGKMQDCHSSAELTAELWRKLKDRDIGRFIKMLVRAGYRNGCQIIQVDQHYASTQLCHRCHRKNTELQHDIRTREWQCKWCREWNDRDRNAAMNILEEGRKLLRGQPVMEGTRFLTIRKG